MWGYRSRRVRRALETYRDGDEHRPLPELGDDVVHCTAKTMYAEHFRFGRSVRRATTTAVYLSANTRSRPFYTDRDASSALRVNIDRVYRSDIRVFARQRVHAANVTLYGVRQKFLKTVKTVYALRRQRTPRTRGT